MLHSDLPKPDLLRSPQTKSECRRADVRLVRGSLTWPWLGRRLGQQLSVVRGWRASPGGLGRRCAGGSGVVRGGRRARAAAGPAGAAVHELRHRDPVAGGLGRVVTVEYEQATMPRSESDDEPGRKVRIAGDDRPGQAAFAPGGKADRLVLALVRNDRGDGAERLYLVRGRAGAVFGAQQDRRQERAPDGIGGTALDDARIAVDDARISREFARPRRGPPPAGPGLRAGPWWSRRPWGRR